MKFKNTDNDMDRPFIAVVILAAGLGTRMKSDRAKVLHEIDGVPMIRYVVDTAEALGKNETIVVIGHQAPRVQSVLTTYPQLKFAHQDEQLGTGHAVMCALPHVSDSIEHVVVLCGDVPLLQASTVSRLVDDHTNKHYDVTILTITMADPTGYGRILTDLEGNVVGIVEEADADNDQKQIKMVNAGIYCINKQFLDSALVSLNTDNAQNELYLTDIIEIARRTSCDIGMVVGDDAIEVTGVNTLAELQAVEVALKGRKK